MSADVIKLTAAQSTLDTSVSCLIERWENEKQGLPKKLKRAEQQCVQRFENKLAELELYPSCADAIDGPAAVVRRIGALETAFQAGMPTQVIDELRDRLRQLEVYAVAELQEFLPFLRTHAKESNSRRPRASPLILCQVSQTPKRHSATPSLS